VKVGIHTHRSFPKRQSNIITTIMAPEGLPVTELGKPVGVDAEFKKISIESLDGQHRDIFTRAVTNVLSTDIAVLTYAQIIDGLPLTDVAQDTSGGGLPDMHPPILRTRNSALGFWRGREDSVPASTLASWKLTLEQVALQSFEAQ
jgi:hypothetical protein